MSFFPPSLYFPSISMLDSIHSGDSIQSNSFFFQSTKENSKTLTRNEILKRKQHYHSLWFPEPKNPIILSSEQLEASEHTLSIQKKHIRKFVHFPDVLVQNIELEDSDLDEGTETEGIVDEYSDDEEEDDETLSLDTSPIHGDFQNDGVN